jgi:hypothetical protein
VVTIVRTGDHTAAVLAALAGAGRPVGDAIRPAGNPPFVVVYPQTGLRSGTVSDPEADASLLYRLMCVGWDRVGAEWMADECAIAMRTITVPGRRVLRVYLENEVAVTRDDDTTPPFFTAAPLWRLTTTPA